VSPRLPLAGFASATATDAATQRALVQRLQVAGVLRSGAERWIGAVHQAPPVTVMCARPAGRRGRTVGFGLALATAVAAATLLLWLRPGEPEPLDIVLDAPEPVREIPLPGLELAYEGLGHVGGDTRSARLSWEQGRVSVHLEPGSMEQLELRTREAIVTVLGTRFEVRRDAMGTHVSVTEGQVEVRCASTGVVHLGVGEHQLCEPVSGPALLGMARALQQRGAAPERIIAALDRAEAAAARGSALRGELIVVRLELLVAEGRLEEALVVAQRYLAAGHGARAEEIANLVGALEQRVTPSP